jgi:hypothetical protein
VFFTRIVGAGRAAISTAMRRILITLFLTLSALAGPAAAWEFTPRPICTLRHSAAAGDVVVTYDAGTGLYAITVRLASGWPRSALFAIRFDGPRGMTISTGRHALSEGGRALTVTDTGFGNVLDGLEFNETATAFTGDAALALPLAGAAPEVRKFRDCATAPPIS